MYLKTLYILCFVPSITRISGASLNSGAVHIAIKIPDSDEVVHTDVPTESTIPKCLLKNEASEETSAGITTMAKVFTDCAKAELQRIEREFEEPPQNNTDMLYSSSFNGIQGKAEKDVDAISSNVTLSKLNNSTSSNPTEMVQVLQTVFDYKRVMTDMQRILRGDLVAVMQEYPQRVNGLFKMVQELPRRLAGSLGLVDRLRSNTNDTTFAGVLTNLRTYLEQATKNAADLPKAFSLVNVVGTLRTLSSRLTGNAVNAAGQPLPTSPSPLDGDDVTSGKQKEVQKIEKKEGAIDVSGPQQTEQKSAPGGIIAGTANAILNDVHSVVDRIQPDFLSMRPLLRTRLGNLFRSGNDSSGRSSGSLLDSLFSSPASKR